jgi:hypothetical protein
MPQICYTGQAVYFHSEEAVLRVFFRPEKSDSFGRV